MAMLALDGWWCCLQVSLLATAALAAMTLRSCRTPAAAARIATVAVGAILVASIEAFLPLPRLAFASSPSAESTPLASAAGPAAAHNSPSAVESGGGVALELATLTRGVGRATAALQAMSQRSAANRSAAWILALVAIGVVVGAAGWVRSWWHVRALRRASRPVADERALATATSVTESIAALGIALPRVVLSESRQVTSPAVVGAAPATVVLPVAWTEWTDAQLRAALAHELAHVARGDYRSRWLAGVVRALHWYHPLIRWLVARLELAQEAAADRLAVAVMGRGESYLQALSQLAVWFDEQPRLRAEPLVVPQLSSNLIRRITMLQSKRDSSPVDVRRRGGTYTAAAIVVLAAATSALRTRAADDASATPTPLPLAEAEGEHAFQREPIDFGLIGDNSLGGFAVRVDEIMQQPRLRALVHEVMFAPADVADLWSREIGADVPSPDLDFSGIELIVGIGQLKLTADSPPTPNQQHTHRVALGAEEWILRFKHPVDWRGWLTRHLPGAREKELAGVAHWELPVIRVLGPQPLCVAELDPRTLVVAIGEGIVAAAQPRPRPSESTLAKRWRELDGGLITFLATDAEIKADPSLPQDLPGRLASDIAATCRGVGYALDVDRDSGRVNARFELLTDDAEQAVAIQTALTTLLRVSQAERPTEGGPLGSFREELLATAVPMVGESVDGLSCVTVHATATLPEELATVAIRSAPSNGANPPRR